ncbi:MAG: M28 family peptidase [Ignavibacteriae bacterium]|nr:M28 family peptidase [Ignavibacteriota bacterium]
MISLFLRRSAVLLFVLCSSFAVGFSGEGDTELAAKLQTHIKYLASDELEGRGSGSAGNRKAAEYIAGFFKQNNIPPLGSSYFQEFNVPTSIAIADGNKFALEITVQQVGVPIDQAKPVKVNWKVGNEYTPLSFSENGTATGKLIFAGYGISAPDLKYDDFEGIDVKGNFIIVVRGTPEGDDNHGKFSSYASLRSKMLTAREKGAAGIIFISGAGDGADSLMELTMGTSDKNSGLIALHAKRMAASKLFPRDRPLVSADAQIIKTKKPNSFEIQSLKLTVNVQLTRVESPTSNVIAVVRGTNPALANEYIVAGAHYDHLGWGEEGTLYSGKEKKIHYGADDNASGTAGIMELASIVSHNPMERPVVFMLFSGEEHGLLGSAYYVKNPIIPLENTVCMLNLDMIGRLKENKINVQGVGTSSRWQSLIDSLGKVYSFTISTSADGFGPSDHSSFFGKDRPVLFVFTGLHSDYHRPTDTWDKINYEGETTVVRFAESVLRTISHTAEKPDFIKVKSTTQTTGGFKVSIGIIPDYSDNPKGLKITGVREGGPAERAGLQGDDIITKFGSTTIKNIYDYTAVLGQCKAGEKLKITVLRGPKEDKEVVLEVIPEAKK